jgi:uncharacterized coiled-coil protein SlyX
MSSISGVGGVQVPTNVRGLDLEMATMIVQSHRANTLETQLFAQLEVLKAKNDKIAALNGVLSQLKGLLAAMPTDAGAATKVGDLSVFKANDYRLEKEINLLLFQQNLAVFSGSSGRRLEADGRSLNTVFAGGISGSSTKEQLENVVATLRSTIDGLSNSQQMDMLRLQSLSNKRNEAFDLMSNFIKKMQDSRSSIIAQLR